ncbi:ABC transporter permease subunit [Virgibacillus dakarensis]|uniref:Transport permease protein n=1 Tax=Lentibacillus populi TaxID=1827502 RepID=A0A9W5TWY4_9BACI|nr:MULTISPECIES: ABC transporter permease [Bacillaceae]MBT2214591.1 ABC transporter permease [Virgibacillus dakarensis]MTW87317.1 ABC transporter permease subunit [Virgibacillus dakarensis]GGB40576.1 transport permease protein [Lentibacillus populi]
MGDILWLMRKTLRTTFRKKGNILLYLVTPLVGIFIALLANGDQGSELTLGVVNHDNKQISMETISFLKGLDNIRVKEIQEEDVKEHVISGKVDSVITFEQGYSESVLTGEPDSLDLTSIKGESVTGFVKSYLYQYIDNLTALSKAAEGELDTFSSLYHDYKQTDFQLNTTALEDSSTSKSMTLSALGFLIMIMMISAANLSEIILAEKANRTYFRLLSTPISARKYIFSNVLVNMMVMLVQVVITLAFLSYVFHIDLNISLWKALLVMAIFSLISVGVSLVIVAFSNSRGAANALTNLIIMPTVMLSGCFWPVEVMPESVQKISEFLPQRWTLDTLTKLQEGSSFGSLYLNILILFAFAAAFFLIAIYKFSRNNSTKSFI